VTSFPKTLSIPEAGAKYYGLSKNGSYDAAARGEIPFIEVGRLKRVPVVAMERLME
jgi:excisionase family DNA binding protein